jgi:hypothetical protein
MKNRGVRALLPLLLKALDKFRNGPQCEVVTFLIDSGTSRSSLCLLPSGLIQSLDRVLISGVKGESCSVKILQETDVYFQDRSTKIQFLLVPEAGTNLFGRDLMI